MLLAFHGNADSPVAHEGNLAAVHSTVSNEVAAKFLDDSTFTCDPVVGAVGWFFIGGKVLACG